MKFSDLVGMELVSIDNDAEEMRFYTKDGRKFRLYHDQDCCESVTIDEIHGDLGDLVDSPILFAEESSNSDNPPSEWAESWLWTFYRIGTIKGAVVVKWLGESNGYYSESVYFQEL